MLSSRYSPGRSSALTLASSSGALSGVNMRHVRILPIVPPILHVDPVETRRSDPVCDPDLPVFMLAPQNQGPDTARRVNIDLEIPKLPPYTDPSFGEIFGRKCELCSVSCSYADPNADTELKEAMKMTLMEFSEFYAGLDITSVSEALHSKTLKMISANILRPLPRVSDALLTADEAPVVAEPSIAILQGFYDLLQRLFRVCPNETLFEPDFHRRLMRCLHSPDVKEHTFVVQCLMQYYITFPKRRDDVFLSACLMLSDYRHGTASPFCVWPLLNYVTRIFKALVPRIPEKWLLMFRNYVAPLATSTHMSWFSDQLMQIQSVVCAADSSAPLTLMSFMIRHFPETVSSKQIAFLKIQTSIAEGLSMSDFLCIYRQFFSQLARCSGCENARVCEVALSIWSNVKLVPIIMDRAKMVFPIVYEPIVAASKNHWNPQTRSAAFDVLKRMRELDGFTYNELSTKQLQSVPQKMALAQQKKWAIVARAAAEQDRDVNIGQALAEIQMVCNAERPLVALSCATIRQSNRRIVVPSKKPPADVWGDSSMGFVVFI